VKTAFEVAQTVSGKMTLIVLGGALNSTPVYSQSPVYLQSRYSLFENYTNIHLFRYFHHFLKFVLDSQNKTKT